MSTVKNVNKNFRDKKMQISLPYPEHWKVKEMQIVEKKRHNDRVTILMAVRVIDGNGNEISDLHHFETPVERRKGAKRPEPMAKPLKTNLLPVRKEMGFVSEDEAFEHLFSAIDHLLHDKGYEAGESPVSEMRLYEKKKERSFLFCVALRCGEEAGTKAEIISGQRKRLGSGFEYALVVPAIQEKLGVPLLKQEAWIDKHNTRFCNDRLCLLGVDCLDPNRIYSFSIYPRDRELMIYFMLTTQQWPMIRERYVLSRSN